MNEKLTGCFNERRVVLFCHERIGQVAEELLKQACHTVDVVKKVLRVPEIKLIRIRICGYMLAWRMLLDAIKEDTVPVSNKCLSLFTCGTEPDKR